MNPAPKPSSSPALQDPPVEDRHRGRYGVEQVTLDLFSSEGAPSPAETRPECIETAAGMPRLAPRRMPQLRVACPSDDGGKRSHTPLWRPFEALER